MPSFGPSHLRRAHKEQASDGAGLGLGFVVRCPCLPARLTGRSLMMRCGTLGSCPGTTGLMICHDSGSISFRDFLTASLLLFCYVLPFRFSCSFHFIRTMCIASSPPPPNSVSSSFFSIGGCVTLCHSGAVGGSFKIQNSYGRRRVGEDRWQFVIRRANPLAPLGRKGVKRGKEERRNHQIGIVSRCLS